MNNSESDPRFSDRYEPAAHSDVDDLAPYPDDLDISIAKPAEFPATMMAAGILWILAGGGFLTLFGLLRILQIPFAASELWLVIGALFFVKDGIQLLLCRFRDPQVDGIISVVFAFLIFGGLAWPDNGRNPADVVIRGLLGLVFLVPGVLVLIGRRKYLIWRMERGM
jgi:hypothetical protein